MTGSQRRAPARHVLRPGVVVVHRPPDRLVVGHDRRRLTLPDTDTARTLLARLVSDGADPPTPDDPAEAWRLWRLLEEGEVLVAVRALRRARAAGVGVATADAAVLAYGDQAGAVLRARAAATTAVIAPPDLHEPATLALRAAGVPLARGTARPVAHLVVDDVAPDPSRLGDLLRRGQPHLVVTRDASGMSVGPFVLPGLTACLGCVEASRADRNPDEGMLRLVRRRRLRERGLPGDPALLVLALATAARDLAVWAAGDVPSTWSATRSFSLAGGEERHEVPRHPRCGCAWDALRAGAG